MNYEITKITKRFSAYELKKFFDRNLQGKTTSQCKKIINKSSLVVGIFIGKELIGIGRALDDGVYAFITDIIVDQNYQRKGIGTMIVKELCRLLNRKRIKVIHCSTDKGLIEFYKKSGNFKYLPEDVTLFRFNK